MNAMQMIRPPKLLARAFRMRSQPKGEFYEVQAVEIWEFGGQPAGSSPQWDRSETRVRTLAIDFDKFGAQAFVAALTVAHGWLQSGSATEPETKTVDSEELLGKKETKPAQDYTTRVKRELQRLEKQIVIESSPQEMVAAVTTGVYRALSFASIGLISEGDLKSWIARFQDANRQRTP